MVSGTIMEINTGISFKNGFLENAKVIAGERSKAAPSTVSPGRWMIPNAPITNIDIPRKYVVNATRTTDLRDIIAPPQSDQSLIAPSVYGAAGLLSVNSSFASIHPA